MNPNLTVYSMADMIAREQLDAKAARGQLAEEAAARGSDRSLVRRLVPTVRAALVRTGSFLQGSAKHSGAIRPVASKEAA